MRKMIVRITNALSRFLGWISCEKVNCYVIVFLVTPGFFLFEMEVVYPSIVKQYNLGIAKQILHTVLPSFLFSNIVGNMWLSILTDTSIQAPSDDGTYCEHCKMIRPSKSWHCKTCNVCILRRDHHCFFFSRCIGLNNQRYYILYLIHIFISMVYSGYYNVYFVLSFFDDGEFILSFFRVVNPLIRFIVTEPLALRDLYVFFLVLNIATAIWSAALVSFHLRNVFSGVTAHESRKWGRPNTQQWKENFLNVFGERWYLTLLCPLISSPVPDNMKFE